MIPRLLATLFLLLNFAAIPSAKGEATPVPLILDTDISSDVDDVGAVAVLHALADQGKADILAMMISSGDPWSAGCLDALNTYFGRPDIPIGMVGEESVVHESKYTQAIAQAYPNNTVGGPPVPDAIDLYRRILARSGDRSVVVVSVGYLTNLGRLLESLPDEASPLDGLELVKRKVKKWVCMGGQYPSGREWNFFHDSAAASRAVGGWPGPVVFVGYETGLDVMTGAVLHKSAAGNPLRRSYELYNELTDRPSWDQLAVLYAVWSKNEAPNRFWELVPGNNTVMPDGSNRWMKGDGASHFYLRLQRSSGAVARIIDELMISTVP